MNESNQVIQWYHMYLDYLEKVLVVPSPNEQLVKLLLNLLGAVQDEMFAYDMTKPRPRWYVDYGLLDIQAHRDMLLMQISHEKQIVDACAKKMATAKDIVDEVIRMDTISSVHKSLFFTPHTVVRMAQEFLWEDEIEQEKAMTIHGKLHKRDDVPFQVHGNITSVLNPRSVLGMTRVRLEEIKPLIEQDIVDMLIAGGIRELCPNRILRRKVDVRTPNGVCLVKTATSNYVKIQDHEGKDKLILTRERKLYVDNLQL